MIHSLDLPKQYSMIQDEIDRAISSVIRDSAFIKGKYVQSFEEHFASYQNADYCVSVGNGTDGLEIAIESLGIVDSDIIVPANSFVAAAEAVIRTGNQIVFCDCDPNNYTISIEDVKRRISPQTKAIIAVHLYGHSCDMDPLLSVAEEYGLKIIEDCAQAHGSEYKGQKVGTLGAAGIFSFFPGKNLGAYGDGGAITTNDKELAVKCRMLANHGRLNKYDHQIVGRNSRLDGLQAAILDVKLKYLEDWTTTRKELATYYHKHLEHCEQVILPKQEAWTRHVYHLFVIRTLNRDHLQQYLKRNQVQTGIHYPIALPKLPPYQYTEQSEEPMIANQIDQTFLSLPIGEHLSFSQLDTVISLIDQFLQNVSN